jgi:hypothetical protein
LTHADLHPAERRSAILRILRRAPVRKQDELVRLLREAGHEATQSSISRDLRELGVLEGRRPLPAAFRGRHARTLGDFGTLARNSCAASPRRGDALNGAAHHDRARRRASPSPSTKRPGPKSSARSPATTRIFIATDGASAQSTAARAPAHSFPALKPTSDLRLGMCKPIVLAYSGGLDTSFLVPWLKETCQRRPVDHRHGRHRRHRCRGRQRNVADRALALGASRAPSDRRARRLFRTGAAHILIIGQRASRRSCIRCASAPSA